MEVSGYTRGSGCTGQVAASRSEGKRLDSLGGVVVRREGSPLAAVPVRQTH